MRLVPSTRVARGLVVLVAAAGLTVLSPASYADPGDGGPTDPGAPVVEAVEDPLAVAEDLVDGTADPDTDPTLVLNQLSEQLPDLTPAEQRQARAILARPTQGGINDGILEYNGDEATPYCLDDVCVHYIANTDSRHYPPADDTNPADDIPDWVQRTAEELEATWARETGTTESGGLGYREPLEDRGTAAPNEDEGPDSKLDVYLGDIGFDGYYGYVVGDRPNPSTSSAYMVLDNDYVSTQFPGGTSAQGLRRATIAHEFFHTVQYAYDQKDDLWFMESTATWMEDQVYDAVNDNRNYLPWSTLTRPWLHLDGPNTIYGNWSFFQFLSERMGLGVVRSMWNRAANPDVYSMLAIRRELIARNTTLAIRFPAYLAAGVFPGRSFDEGARWPQATPSRTWTLGTSTRSTGRHLVRINHLAGRHYAVKPGASLTGTWRLRVAVDGPAGVTRALVTVDRTDGTLVRKSIPLKADGSGSVTVGFARATTRRAVITLANTSVGSDSRAFTFSAGVSR